MKARWRYTYRTSDGAWHESSVRAPSRDEAFAKLKRRGIKPVRVDLESGALNSFKALGRRGLAIILLVACLAATLAYAILARAPRRDDPAAPQQQQQEAEQRQPAVRRQIPSLPEDWIQRLSDYFDSADSYLALCAQPGCREALDIMPDPDLFTGDAFADAPDEPRDGEPEWVADIRAILVGMKEEARALERAGKSPSEVIMWLRERQRMENSYRLQILSGPEPDDEKRLRLQAVGLLP